MIHLPNLVGLQQAIGRYGDPARPDRLPKPACKVMLVCGPPGAGKSTYVRERMGARDSVIDLDDIAKEHGYGRDRPRDVVGMLLMDRNERLAALATAPPGHVAWVILTAPSARLRAWWCASLCVADDDLILLMPPRDEVLRRIHRDPERQNCVELQTRLALQWFVREYENKPYPIRGCDPDGWPTDPMHPWRQEL